MMDIHSHILPGIDDGASSMDETLGIVRQLQEAGFNTLIATPHVMDGNSYAKPAEILAATERVKKCILEAGIHVDILPGAENYIFPDMVNWVLEGKLLTLGNTKKYLLVELPLLEIPLYTDHVFFNLQVNGITPVLAHPERYKALSEKPERLLEWAKKGILFQLNLRSLSGKYGPQPLRLAKLLLQNHLIHFIGSDAHRVSRNPFAYKEVLRHLHEIPGEKLCHEFYVPRPAMQEPQ
ncbi:CpsB/CapC family capsule biosynthesis tyrosine phosphatase [Desulfitobacterium sp. THU1]|uniref:tyrosine-protein phosphatase n=1 Tax=Desulfitobacterium sp. THU1 TaxID=3138072 RepID=UPI00311D64E8